MDFHENHSSFSLSSASSKGRILEVFYSRLCLKKALLEIGLKLSWDEFQFNENYRLKKYPHLPISISHTKKKSIAVLGVHKSISSVGVDIEEESRIVKPKVLERVKNDSDILCLSPLDIWLLKESAYKCLYPFQKENLKDLFIKDHSIESLSSPYHCRWELIKEKGYIIAFTYCDDTSLRPHKEQK